MRFAPPDGSSPRYHPFLAAQRQLRIFYCFGLVLYLLPVCGKFWQIFRPFFKFLQFPNRLLVPAAVLMVFSVGFLFSSVIPSEQRKRTACALLLATAFYTGMNYIGNSFEMTEDFGSRVLYQEIAGLGAGEEYLPLETTRDDLTTPNTAFSGTGETVAGTRRNEVFLFSASPGSDYYDVPFVWYKGYRAYTEAGDSLKVVKNPGNGLVRVMTDSLDQTAVIRVFYAGTPLITISCIISACSFLLLFGYGIRYFIKDNHHPLRCAK